ncbi:RNA polymerase sigma factor [Dorea formicigenerans]|uniref:RNA polymerase sigma factor n=1 Tax=Dorea formicigenerans TaxID=39486 RepID=UPI0016428925|nr:sigma factor [Dorea formicigenerans]
MKDEEIIREVQRGQTKLFEELVRKYYEKIYRYCYYHISNEHSALDITQEVFMKIYENIEIYENKGKRLILRCRVVEVKCLEFDN